MSDEKTENDEDLPPITIECRICGERIELNEDSPETRERKEDPHQQIRQHMRKHVAEISVYAHAAGFMTSMLFFRGQDARWTKRAHELLDWYMKTGMEERLEESRAELAKFLERNKP